MWGLCAIPAVAAMVISDCRSRTVGIIPLACFGITMLLASIMDNGIHACLRNIAANLVLCLTLLSALAVYFRIRRLRFAEALGDGDVVFIILITPYFTPERYVMFLVSASVCTLTIWLILSVIGKRDDTIPFISGLGLCLICVIIYRTVIGFI